MKAIKVSELRAKTAPELKEQFDALSKDLSLARMQHQMGKLTDTRSLSSLRATRARIMLVLGEKEE